jgi:signal transduction histidine kinase
MRVTSRNSTPATSADSASDRHRSGLRRALFVALTLALVLPGIVAGALLIYLNLQHTVDSDARVRAEKLADILQAGLALPLWEITPESGIPLLDAVSTDVSVDAIHVIDAEGTSVLEFSRSDEKGEDTAGPMTIKRTITKSGETLGEVTLVYGTTRAREAAMQTSRVLLAVVVVQLLVSFLLLGAWLTRRVLRPLDALRVSAETIAGGDLQSPVPSLRADEFGALASRLESMRDSLAQAVTGLEERVERRTNELQEVNARLQGTLEDLRRMQQSLVQSEKLASLGSLVAGLSHELNTPIGTGVTIVSTIVERCADLQKQVESGIRRSQLDAFVDDVTRASHLAQSSLERAARLLLDFKQVAVDQTSSRRREFQLAELVREMMVALNIRYKHSLVRIALHIPDGIAMDSYPGAIEQIVSNLVENAVVHAFEGRAQCRVDIAAQALGERVVLTVTDNGNGIPAEHQSHIFDPLFTTRLGKGGSGLGLSIAYGLVTGMLGGQISVDSAPGAGARFTLDLPLTAPEHPALDAEGTEKALGA